MPRLPLSRCRRARTSSRPRVEPMEARLLLATFTVINTDDSGRRVAPPGDRRTPTPPPTRPAALDTIAFNIPGAGVHTITPLTGLPQITDPVIIDGYTQPGSRRTPTPSPRGSMPSLSSS